MNHSSPSTKTVVITGASAGIGLALAQSFAQQGFNLALCARRKDKLEQLCNQLSEQHPQQAFNAYSLDVSDLPQVSQVFSDIRQAFTSLDIVIANAGITGVRRTGNGELETDQRIIQTNLLGAIATIDAAVNIFREQGFGQIVGISSFSAFVGIPGSAAYSASKAALSNYLQAVRSEVQRKNIDVCCIHPGFINTDIAQGMDKYPFVIEADKAAGQISKAILAKKASATIPAMPWALVRGILPWLPDSLLAKVF